MICVYDNYVSTLLLFGDMYFNSCEQEDYTVLLNGNLQHCDKCICFNRKNRK